MKHIVKSLVVAGALVSAGAASADMFSDFRPMVGVDFQQTWNKGRGAFGRLGQRHTPGGTVYIGGRFCDNWGVELGWDWNSGCNRRRTRTLSADDVSGNLSFLGTAGQTVRSRFNRCGAHLDLIGYLPIADCVDLTGHIGAGWVRAHARLTNTTTNTVFSVRSRQCAVLRLGVGISGMVTEFVGLRAKLGWETTGHLRGRVRNVTTGTNVTFPTGGNNRRFFGDAVTLSLGAFVAF